VLNNLGLGFVFTAEDLASGVMRKVHEGFEELEGKTSESAKRIDQAMKLAGVGFGIAAAGAATVGGALLLAQPAAQFEQAVVDLGSIAGASAAELEALRKAAMDAGIATQFSPAEALVGLQNLAQAGFNARESIQLLNPVLDLAAGSLGKLSPEAAAGLAAQAMKAFGVATKDAGKALDQMAKVSAFSAVNFEDLPLALGVASRGAGALNQSLQETLISFGLVKNVIPTIERSSTGTAVAMEKLANPRVQKSLAGIGVAVADSTGKFRDFLDIMVDLAPRLQAMTEQQRGAFLDKTFGAEAMGGVNAILTQLTNGLTTSSGATVKLGDAVKYLRGEMESATGTLAKFRDARLDTLAGQQTLLRGSLETLAISIGEPFAKVFKPIVAVVVDFLNRVIKAIERMPSGLKTFLAGLVVVAGVLTTVTGLVIAAQAAIATFAIIGPLLAPLVPIIANAALAVLIAFALIAVAGAALKVAWDNNLGGIASAVERTFGKIRMFFDGLFQLISKGEISGPLVAEFQKAENQGLLGFVVSAYRLFTRLKAFFLGVWAGFQEAIKFLEPAWEALSLGVETLMIAVGDLLGALFGVDALADSSKMTWADWGKAIGAILGTVVSFVAAAIGGIVQVLAFAVEIVRFIVDVLWTVIRVFVAGIDTITDGLAQFFAHPIDTVMALVKWIGRGIAAVLEFFGILDSEEDKRRNRQDKAVRRFTHHQTVEDLAYDPDVARSTGTAREVAGASSYSPRSSPAVAEAEGRALNARASSAGVEDAVRRGFAGTENRPVHARVELNLDGEKLAEATVRADRRRAIRSFTAPGTAE
jgi:TP901 family phage tail tape measure protein